MFDYLTNDACIALHAVEEVEGRGGDFSVENPTRWTKVVIWKSLMARLDLGCNVFVALKEMHDGIGFMEMKGDVACLMLIHHSMMESIPER